MCVKNYVPTLRQNDLNLPVMRQFFTHEFR